MNFRRRSTESLSNLEMLSWCFLHGVRLTPFEAELIDGAEALWRVQFADKAKAETK